MRKNILLISRHAPYGTSLAKDAIDAALVCAAYEQNISLLFRDDGVYQLLKNQASENIQQKNFASILQSLEYYELDQIYIHQDSLEQRAIRLEQLVIDSVKLVDDQSLAQLINQQNHILSF